MSGVLREQVEDGAGQTVFSLGGLIGIGGGADGDGFSGGERAQFGAERGGIEVFDVNLLFEVFGLAELHEFVGVAGVAILAAEFAAAIGVDHPAEGHARAGAARYVFAGGELEVFGAALGFERGALGG